MQVVLFDVQQRSTIAELSTPFIKYCVWSSDMGHVALLSKHAIIIANKRLGNSCTGLLACSHADCLWCQTSCPWPAVAWNPAIHLMVLGITSCPALPFDFGAWFPGSPAVLLKFEVPQGQRCCSHGPAPCFN